MKYNAKDLLKELRIYSQEHIKIAQGFLEESTQTLNEAPGIKKWSALECLEHLNLYGDFYLPEITQKINASNSRPREMFKSTWFANKTVLAMLPNKQGNVGMKMDA